MDIDIPGDSNRDPMDADGADSDSDSDVDGSDDEPQYIFYDRVDENDETDDDGIGSDCDGDVEEFGFDSEFEIDLESDADSDSEDEDEDARSAPYIDIGVGLDGDPDGEPEADNDGDIVVSDASGSENDNSAAEINANTEANKKDADKDPEPRVFDLQKALDKMSSIDMGDDGAVEKMIGDAISPSDRQSMEMSQEKMDGILSKLPDNAEGLDMVENEPEVRRCIEKYRERLRFLIMWLARLMLAIGDCSNVPQDMKPWVIFTVANASAECRERLLNVFTQPAIHPFHYQYLLGKDRWTPDMFKGAPKIDLKNPDEAGDCTSTYLGIGRREDGTYYMYVGSASGTNPTAGAIGEGVRMRVHHTILNAGLDAVLRERQSTVRTKGAQALLVHELFVQCIEYSFMALFRFPIDMEDPVYPMCAALAPVAENLMMLLLNSLTTTRVPRHSRNVRYQAMSQAFMVALSQEVVFPDGGWVGANVVLPMVQTTAAIWALRRKHRRLVLSPEIEAKLRKRFDETRDLTLLPKECRRLLALENASDTVANVQALQALYAAILREHNQQFLTSRMLLFKKRCILVSAMIEEAEHEKLSNGPHADGYHHLNVSLLNWGHVSQKAQDRAGEELCGYFTTAADCRNLFNGGKHDFYKNAMHEKNWEALRRGVPGTLEKIKAEPSYPRPIRKRLREICQAIVYQHLAKQGWIEETPTKVQLENRQVCNKERLLIPIIKRLKQDVGLSTSVKAADGVWDSETLKRRVVNMISQVIKDLKAGLTRSDADLWANLKEVDSRWAEPQAAATDIGILLPELPQQPMRQTPQPLPSSNDDHQDETFQLLLSKHVSPDRICNINQRARLYNEGMAAADTVLLPEDMPAPGQVPFNLCGPDGEPLPERGFTCESLEPQSRHGLTPKLAQRTGGVRTKCDHCGDQFKLNPMAMHMFHCRGNSQAAVNIKSA
ncbi:hypothetical protein Neosp_005950 [[Neocosmospora] mangrovei]